MLFTQHGLIIYKTDKKSNNKKTNYDQTKEIFTERI